jgi:hypothetical protein
MANLPPVKEKAAWMLQRWLDGRIATLVASAQPMPAEQFAGGRAMEIEPFG